MEAKTFQLTFRTEDIREIYQVFYDYKTVNRKNLPLLAVIPASALLLGLVLTSGMDPKNGIYPLLLVILSIGIGGPLFYLLQAAGKVKQVTNGSDKFMESALKHPACTLTFEFNTFNMLRDGEIFTFSTGNLKDTKRTEHFLFLVRTDGFRLFLPKKAFEDGQFEIFMKHFDEMIANAPIK
jgi:hypothetical protein